jgi:hypothetical protein
MLPSFFGLRMLAVALLFSSACAALRATTVVPPSFPQLVAQSDTIVRARVTAVQAAWVDSPQGRVIKTYVTLDVQKQLKGTPARELTLQFLGGELDGQGMRVEGMPRFVVGQTELLFIAGNGARFCPLVAMMHGRYRVVNDATTAHDYIARNDGVPLTNIDDVQLPQTGNPLEAQLKRASAALSPTAFEQQITAEISRRALP